MDMRLMMKSFMKICWPLLSLFTPKPTLLWRLSCAWPQTRFGFECVLSFLPDLKKASEDIAQALFDNELR